MRELNRPGLVDLEVSGGSAPSSGTEDLTAGFVSFIGAGPGDTELITVRATELLAQADVIISDRPGHEALIAKYARSDARVECTGLSGDAQSEGTALSRAARNKLITASAREGAYVVRLLTGDAGLFSCLTDEIAGCLKAGIGFDVVPGVSTATAVPLFAGVPMTPQGVNAVHVVHAHQGDIDWSCHLSSDATLVVMGELDEVKGSIRELIQAGADPVTPIAVTAQGSTAQQHTEISTLGQAPRAWRKLELPAPVVMVVGEAVNLRDDTSWFETKALFGWRVLVPRTQSQASSMVERLRVYGATEEIVPTISVEPPRTPAQMERAVKGLVTGAYAWVGFTSVNAVRAVREKVEAFGLDVRAFAGVKVAAVGAVTADALREWGIIPDLVPSTEQSSAGLLADWPEFDPDVDGLNKVLLPRADIATDTLVAGLPELGWEVEDVTAYRTVRAAPPAVEIREDIKGGRFDAVVFTSASTVRNLVGIAGKPHSATIIACIGPATAKAAQEHGLRVDVLASEPSSQVLIDELADYAVNLRRTALESGVTEVRPSHRRGAGRRKRRQTS